VCVTRCCTLAQAAAVGVFVSAAMAGGEAAAASGGTSDAANERENGTLDHGGVEFQSAQ